MLFHFSLILQPYFHPGFRKIFVNVSTFRFPFFASAKISFFILSLVNFSNIVLHDDRFDPLDNGHFRLCFRFLISRLVCFLNFALHPPKIPHLIRGHPFEGHKNVNYLPSPISPKTLSLWLVSLLLFFVFSISLPNVSLILSAEF